MLLQVNAEPPHPTNTFVPTEPEFDLLYLEIIARNAKSGGSYTNKVDTFSIAMTFLVMSVPELRNANTRFELWKNLIEPKENELWPSADTIASILSGKNYDVFSGNDNLLTVLSNALCEPNTRYDPQSFQSAFENAV